MYVIGGLLLFDILQEYFIFTKISKNNNNIKNYKFITPGVRFYEAHTGVNAIPNAD